MEFPNSWCCFHASPKHPALMWERRGEEGGGRASGRRDTPMTKPHWKAVGHWSLSEAFQEVLLCETLWKSLSARLAPGAQESSQAVSPCELSKCPWMSSGQLAMPTPRLSWPRGGGTALWPAGPLSHQLPPNSCHRCYPPLSFCIPNSDSASGNCKPASPVTTSRWWLSNYVGHLTW